MPRSKKSTIQNNPLEQISQTTQKKKFPPKKSEQTLNTRKKILLKKDLSIDGAIKTSSIAAKKRASSASFESKAARPVADSSAKPVIKHIKPAMRNRELRATAIIKKWARLASACAIPPIPLISTISSSGIQIKMIKDLCTIYDIPFHRELTKATISSIVGSGATLFSLNFLAKELLHGIPYAGNAALILTQPAAIYGLTNSLGSIFMHHFENDGDLTNLNLDQARALLKHKASSKAASKAT